MRTSVKQQEDKKKFLQSKLNRKNPQEKIWEGETDQICHFVKLAPDKGASNQLNYLRLKKATTSPSWIFQTDCIRGTTLSPGSC